MPEAESTQDPNTPPLTPARGGHLLFGAWVPRRGAQHWEESPEAGAASVTGSPVIPQILLNQTRVRQSFSKNGVTVTLTGATGMRVDIPAVGVSITFNGRVFQARLSYSHFNHNTEGQCGERELQDACGGGEGLAPALWVHRSLPGRPRTHTRPPHLPRREALFDS